MCIEFEEFIETLETGKPIQKHPKSETKLQTSP